MNSKKIVGIIIIILGIIGLILSVFANLIAIGPFGKSPGFGFQQTSGTILGVIFIVVGAFLTFKK